MMKACTGMGYNHQSFTNYLWVVDVPLDCAEKEMVYLLEKFLRNTSDQQQSTPKFFERERELKLTVKSSFGVLSSSKLSSRSSNGPALPEWMWTLISAP